MIILKYTILAFNLPYHPFRDVYNLTVTRMICSILAFNLNDLEMESKKYELMYYPDQTKLLLKNLMSYIYTENVNKTVEVDVMISERKAKSPLTLFLLQIYPSVCTAETLCIILVELPESRFTTSLSLFDINDIYCYACIVISIDKYFCFLLDLTV